MIWMGDDDGGPDQKSRKVREESGKTVEEVDLHRLHR